MVKYNEININSNSNVIFKKKNIILQDKNNGSYMNIFYKNIYKIGIRDSDIIYQIIIYYNINEVEIYNNINKNINKNTFTIYINTKKEQDELLNNLLSNIG
jgi:hypothetical protein